MSVCVCVCVCVCAYDIDYLKAFPRQRAQSHSMSVCRTSGFFLLLIIISERGKAKTFKDSQLQKFSRSFSFSF